VAVDPQDHGNLERASRSLPPARTNQVAAWQRIMELPNVEAIAKHDGRVSLRVRGVEFAELDGADLRFGLSERRRAANIMCPRLSAWLKSWTASARPNRRAASTRSTANTPKHGWNRKPGRRSKTIDASLKRSPVYGQVPAFAGGRARHYGSAGGGTTRAPAVVELKASPICTCRCRRSITGFV